MSVSPSVAIVILNWNGKKFLENFLPSVFSSTYNNFFVVVADNGSNDDSIRFIENNYQQIKILKFLKNNGFAKGYNDALKLVTADYYILLNNDVEVKNNWIEPVIDLMQSDSLIAACQPKVLSYNDKKRFEYAGACGGWIDTLGYPFTRGRIFDTCEVDDGKYDSVAQIFWATGACLFLKSEAFHSIGGFDEYFFAHQEEIDLCWRLQLEGYKIFVQPKSVVYHVGGGTLAKGNMQKVFLNFRNNLIMLSKNLPFLDALWKIPVRIGLDNIAAIKSLLAKDKLTFRALIKAHVHYFKWLLFKREKNKSQGKKNRKFDGFYNGLIVWQYFIRKKKLFSEIIKTKNDF